MSDLEKNRARNKTLWIFQRVLISIGVLAVIYVFWLVLAPECYKLGKTGKIITLAILISALGFLLFAFIDLVVVQFWIKEGFPSDFHKIHLWNGCRCSVCGKNRDKKHDWNGCICRICGERRDKNHNWNGCKCTVCGEVRDEQHTWGGCKCTVCGKQKPVEDPSHQWNETGCVCMHCGKQNHSFEVKEYESPGTCIWAVSEPCTHCSDCSEQPEIMRYEVHTCTKCGYSYETDL